MSLKYVQSNTLYLAGSGVIIGATSITLTTLTDIYANVLTMASFGTKGYVTLEPDTTNEEAATFTGITANANGTYTLTGVSTVLAQSPYTETSGLIRQHSGGTKLVITDNVGFWNTFTNKQNDEALVGRWTTPVVPLNPNDIINKSYADGLAIAGSPDATTTTKGIGRVSVAPVSPTIPIFVGDNDTRVPTQGENDAMVGNNTDVAVGTGNKFVTQTGLQHSAEKYVLCASGSSTTYTGTYSPAPTSITNGMEFFLKIDVANTTTTPTFNPNGLGAKTIVKGTSTALAVNDLIIGQIARFIYDGTNMVLQNPSTIASSVGSYVGVPLATGSVISTQNIDTVYTSNFTAKNITVYFTIAGKASGSASSFKGIAVFNGTSVVSTLDSTFTTFGTTNPTAGDLSGSHMQVIISVTSVTTTQFTVRASFNTADSSSGSASFFVTATA